MGELAKMTLAELLARQDEHREAWRIYSDGRNKYWKREADAIQAEIDRRVTLPDRHSIGGTET